MSKTNNTYISVIISDYNRKTYIIKALESVINQTLPRNHYEVILVKNFSDQEIDEFARSNYIKTSLSQDKTLSGKIKEGLLLARGDIICFLDDDDMFYNNKLEYIYNKFKNDDNLVYLHNNFSAVDSNGKAINYGNTNPDFNMSSITIRKNIIQIDTLTEVSKSIDTLMYLYALESGMHIELDNKVLTYYRVTENSVTHSFQDMESFRNFSMISLNRILESYIRMQSLFKSRKVIKFLKHLESFTRIRISLFGGKRPVIKDYFQVLFTPSMDPKYYELKIIASSIFFKNYAVKMLYENENRKKEYINA